MNTFCTYKIACNRINQNSCYLLTSSNMAAPTHGKTVSEHQSRMSKTALGLLPPSPNWYCSRASDTSQDGILAFGTKNTVFLLNTKTNPPTSEGKVSLFCLLILFVEDWVEVVDMVIVPTCASSSLHTQDATLS